MKNENKCKFYKNNCECSKNGPNTKVYIDFNGYCAAGKPIQCQSYIEKIDYFFQLDDFRDIQDAINENFSKLIGVKNVQKEKEKM